MHAAVGTLGRIFRAAEGESLPAGVMEPVIRIKRHPITHEIIPAGPNQVGIGLFGVNMPGAGRRDSAVLVGSGGDRGVVNLFRPLAGPHVLLGDIYQNKLASGIAGTDRGRDGYEGESDGRGFLECRRGGGYRRADVLHLDIIGGADPCDVGLDPAGLGDIFVAD